MSRPLLAKKPGTGEPQSRDQTIFGQAEARRVNELIQLASRGPPPKVVECIRACKPVLELFVALVRFLGPVIFSACKALYKLYCVTPVNELRMIYGVALCFFGGEFCASIAAVECFRRTGGEKLMLCVKDLADNVQAAAAASARDDLVDDNADGIMDVAQLSMQGWYKRKVGVVLKAVDPDVLAQAFAGLYQGFLGVIMTLKFKFAWTVALACSIADLLRKPVALVATPVLVALLPKDYHKWINQMINFTLKAIAVHYAWKLQMLVSAVQSGLMGASLVGAGFVTILLRLRPEGRKFDPEKSYVDEAIGLPLATAGIWFQLKHGFGLPFPLNIALLPLTIVEEVLRFCITWFPVTDSLPGRA